MRARKLESTECIIYHAFVSLAEVNLETLIFANLMIKILIVTCTLVRGKVSSVVVGVKRIMP